MKKSRTTANDLSLSLLQIHMGRLPEGDDPGTFTPAPLDTYYYDDRSHLVLYPDTIFMSVRVELFNHKALGWDFSSGIRRKVSVTVTDTELNTLVARKVMTLIIPKGEVRHEEFVSFMMTRYDVDPHHIYKVEVRDETRNDSLGERDIRFFDTKGIETPENMWYTAVRGGILDTYLHHDNFYRSYESCTSDFLTVAFDLRPIPGLCDFMPMELGVRLYLPDGSEKTVYRTPVEMENGLYRLLAPLTVTEATRGVTYAEVICADFIVCGMVFSTEGPEKRGSWTRDGLAPTDTYEDEAYALRLRRAFNQPGGDEDDEEDEEDDDDDDDPFAGFSDLFDFSEPSEVSELSEVSEPSEVSEASDTSDTHGVVPFASLTGLESVKRKLEVYEKTVLFNMHRSRLGLATYPQPLHAMFMGAPGTGKTTVASKIGSILKRAGVLSKGHVVIRERATLLGPNYSNEETNTLKAIEEAKGGILLIDEAYQLCQPNDPRDPGKFVIETLMTALADEKRRDWMLILAGYPEKMQRMFDLNPGLRSRIPESNIYMFDNFTEPQLMEIAERYLERNDYTLSPEAREALQSRLHADLAAADETFGNARHVINLIQTDIIPAMAVRLADGDSSDPSALSTILPSDIPAPVSNASARRRIGF